MNARHHHYLRRDPAAVMDKPFHSLLFYLPVATLNVLADQAGVPRISELRHEPGVPVWDETIKHLGLSLIPAFSAPAQINTVVHGPRDARVREPRGPGLWRNAGIFKASQGWVSAMAGAAVERNDRGRSHRYKIAARGRASVWNFH
jgi:hypothetical protein